MPKQNTFLIWRGGSPADFELDAEYRLTGGNSGIQYRSSELPDIRWAMKGYQADIDAEQQYTGQIYEERGRGFLALRGQAARVEAGAKPMVLGSLGSDAELKAAIQRAGLERVPHHRARQRPGPDSEWPRHEHADRRRRSQSQAGAA